MKVPCVLTIAGSDSGGGAGIQADLKTFAALGVHGLSVLTAVTAQNTRGVFGVLEVPPDFIGKQIDTVTSDFDVDWTKTGMLSSAGIIKVVKKKAAEHRLRLVVDPVMISATGHPLLDDAAVSALEGLVARAELVTPNIHEAQKLSGTRITSVKKMLDAAEAIRGLGPKAVFIKGGHLRGKTVTDVLYDGKEFKKLEGRRIVDAAPHGTGCSISSAITAELAKGERLETAVKKAKKFIENSIAARLKIGKGVEPVNPMAQLYLQAEKGRAVEEVWTATKLLLENRKFAKLIPQVGSNIVMTLPDAKTTREVVGLSGRIVRVGKTPQLTGFPEWGGSNHVANIAITAHTSDPRIRAAMNIRYSPEIVGICKKLGLRLGTFDRAEEPRGVKTMVWGTKHAIKKAGRVPTVIYDKGGKGKEPMTRLLGTSPLEIAALAAKIAESLKNAKDF
jgi:hydroxymethylpyrimidine/phosphomethylpyrimidine kinase